MACILLAKLSNYLIKNNSFNVAVLALITEGKSVSNNNASLIAAPDSLPLHVIFSCKSLKFGQSQLYEVYDFQLIH